MVWKEAKDARGRVYYYDTVTRATSWTLPKTEKPQEPSQEEEKKQQQHSEVLDESQAKERFTQMLKDHGVDIQWTFHRVMDELATREGDRYWFSDTNDPTDPNAQWDDPLWKQSVWQEYVWNQQSQRLEDHIASFQSLLKQKYDEGKLKFWYPWEYTKKHVLQMDTDYSFVILDDPMQRKLYYQYLNELKLKRENEQNKLHIQAQKEMKLYLQSILVDNPRQWTWDQIVNKYLSRDNKRYMANKNFQLLTMEDNLALYIEILTQHETKLKAELTELEELNYTRDRFCRDRFKSLLREKNGPLEIKFNSSWTKDIYPQVKNDPRFLNLVGRHGSTPLELFHDRLYELNTILKAQWSIIENILIERGIDITTTITTKQQLKQLLHENEQTIMENVGDDKKVNVDDVVEFVFHQRYSQQLQLFQSQLPDLVRTYTKGNVIPSWKVLLSKLTHEEYELLTAQEMHEAYDQYVEQVKQSIKGADFTKKRSLDRMHLDY